MYNDNIKMNLLFILASLIICTFGQIKTPIITPTKNPTQAPTQAPTKAPTQLTYELNPYDDQDNVTLLAVNLVETLQTFVQSFNFTDADAVVLLNGSLYYNGSFVANLDEFTDSTTIASEEVTITPPPTQAPTSSTLAPTLSPNTPTSRPTNKPTSTPTKQPTRSPTKAPTQAPTQAPTKSPTQAPTVSQKPTQAPTNKPTKAPTNKPTKAPTQSPTICSFWGNNCPTVSPILIFRYLRRDNSSLHYLPDSFTNTTIAIL